MQSDSDVDADNEWSAASEPVREAEDNSGELVADSATGIGGEEGGFLQSNAAAAEMIRNAQKQMAEKIKRDG